MRIFAGMAQRAFWVSLQCTPHMPQPLHPGPSHETHVQQAFEASYQRLKHQSRRKNDWPNSILSFLFFKLGTVFEDLSGKQKKETLPEVDTKKQSCRGFCNCSNFRSLKAAGWFSVSPHLEPSGKKVWYHDHTTGLNVWKMHHDGKLPVLLDIIWGPVCIKKWQPMVIRISLRRSIIWWAKVVSQHKHESTSRLESKKLWTKSATHMSRLCWAIKVAVIEVRKQELLMRLHSPFVRASQHSAGFQSCNSLKAIAKDLPHWLAVTLPPFLSGMVLGCTAGRPHLYMYWHVTFTCYSFRNFVQCNLLRRFKWCTLSSQGAAFCTIFFHICRDSIILHLRHDLDTHRQWPIGASVLWHDPGWWTLIWESWGRFKYVPKISQVHVNVHCI